MMVEPHAERAQLDEPGPFESGYPAGTLPPPETLRRYDALIPGAAERIIRMVEEEGQRRYQLDTARLRGEAIRAILAVCFGATIALILVAGGIVVTLTGDRAASPGAPFLVFGIAILIGVLIFVNAQRHPTPPTAPAPPPPERVGRAYDPQGFEL